MLYYTTTHADVAESFLLGLSCLVGGDQFYIFISKTDASPKTQSYIAITAVLSTLFLALVFYDRYNRSLFDITHVLYLVLLVIWGLILYQNVKNPFVTTYYTSMLGMVMTFLVIISCVHYSHQKELLPSFLSGMLFARLLPTILWIFVHQKNAESNSNLSSLSARLAFFRLVFGIISMILKFTSGNLDFSGLNVGIKQKYDWHVIRSYAFMNLAEKFIRLFKDPGNSFKFNNISLNFFIFFFSIVLYLGLPPIVHKFSHLYSHHFYSTIDIMRTLSHILGVGLATKYPASKTANSYYFGGICLGYLVYIFGLPIVNNRCKFTSPIHLYSIVVLNGFVLGYVWSYSLGIIINTILNPTCLYEDVSGLIPCCGDKTESQCYCRYTLITIESNKPVVQYYSNTRMIVTSSYCLLRETTIPYYPKRFSCSRYLEMLGLNRSFVYCHNGSNAILLLYNGEDCTKIGNCTTQCNNNECCLKIIGKYKIESVTTSTCQDCQFTIRIEGTCSDPSKCPCCNDGAQCTCGSGTDCCCLCLKCCDSACQGECKCCIRLCNKTGCSCNCKITYGEGVRVFICFNNNDKCCVREIRPNFSKEFTADLTVQNLFDIKSIVISDCCHTDLTVDIQCSMKNNFFRSSPINYPKKSIRPLSLTLMRNGSECCKPGDSKCCCKNTNLVAVCVKYDGTEKNCEVKCTCKGSPQSCCCQGSSCPCASNNTNCCCCLTCSLNVSKISSFYQKVQPVRVKMVLILWFFFLIFLMIAISTESRDKNKKLKYYQFFPVKSFETVKTYVDINDMNSIHSVLARLRSVQQNIILELFGEKDKKTDLERMLQLCKCALNPCSLNTLRHYVLSKSSMLIASPHYINRRLNLELVKWSYCVGFVYTYIMLMFFRIQEYFLKWELVWEREYSNYKRIMTAKFNNLTKKSKSSMSLMCEKGVDHKTTLYTDTSKKGGWGCSNVEMDIHANLNERETEMNKSPPHRLDLRLMFFLDKWKHRVENLSFWTENETNVYDWTGLLKEYPDIRTWVFNFFPHIERTSHEWNIPFERLNKGTEILQSKTLNLAS